MRTLIALLAATSLAWSAAGDLDTTFANNGIMTHNFVGSETPVASVKDANGRIIMVGAYNKPNLTSDVIVARFNPDGSPDTTFGNNGYVLFDKGDEEWANGVAIDQNGKILVTGVTNVDDDAYKELLIIRFNEDGSLDTTFGGGDGFVAEEITMYSGYDGMAIGVDGDKIVVVGSTFDLKHGFLARYTSSGDRDATFANGGLLTYDANTDDKEQLYSLIIDDNQYVAGGIHTDSNDNRNFLILRVSKDGNTIHEHLISPSTGDDLVMQNGSSLHKDVQGRYLIVGMSDPDGNNKFEHASVARIFNDGTPDHSFGSGGLKVYPMNNEVMITSVTTDDDGRIYIGGDIVSGSSSDALVLRLAPDGSLDPDFANNGVATIQASGGSDTVYTLLMDQGKLLGTGVAKIDQYGGSGDFMIFRLLTAGTETPEPTPSTVTVPFGWPAKGLLALLLALAMTTIGRRKR